MSRRPSRSSSTMNHLHAAPPAENAGKRNGTVSRKRAPLSNIANQCNASHLGSKSYAASTALVPCTTKIAKTEKESFAAVSNSDNTENYLPAVKDVNLRAVFSCQESTSQPRRNETVSRVSMVPNSCNVDGSARQSSGSSDTMDESMSSCDSFSRAGVENFDINDVPAVDSIDRDTFSSLYISDRQESSVCTRDGLLGMETDKLVDINEDYSDSQLCAFDACDIYKHLRASEAKKRPSTDYMENVQKDITPNMRAILVDWLVEVAEEYRLVPDTLYLTVNYLDRYLSGNVINKQRLQLLGVSCMMIACKYEEICAPQVEEYCYITDNTYLKEEILEMESAVSNYLKFEMAAPTVKCFLRRFTRAAQGIHMVLSMQLESMINYIAELSLLEYGMLLYAPSLIAASAIFLAKYILFPSKRPWDSTLQHYTLYKASDLRDCVKDLHSLCCDNQNSNLLSIKEKYGQPKHKCVTHKYCPPTIPSEYF